MDFRDDIWRRKKEVARERSDAGFLASADRASKWLTRGARLQAGEDRRFSSCRHIQ